MNSTTIQCEELAEKLSLVDSKNLKILYTTMAKGPISKPTPPNIACSEYIPDSLFFDFESDFVDHNASLSNMMPNREVFQASARNLGLNIDDEIVVYDDLDNFCASRAWFMLLSMGFENVRTLDGGLKAWNASSFDTHSNLSQVSSPSNVRLNPSSYFSFVNADYLVDKLSSNSSQRKVYQIIDARSPGRFAGSEAEPRENMRSGHIPTSVNIYYASLLEAACFKSKESLRAMFNENNIQLDNEIITSCGSGITACIIAQAAYSLGASCIRVYDGSWSEWGASQSFPVEVSQ
ncbi:sulfurtransferase [Glaciecola sp.]|jgi:thiosulfate/3-mercaptopyruvate sulfurtransferase|uniref:sulfurtransferase n=1 Tax=Glaciecola sp. MF2-115 TaxID=3384827 RepID=UPI003988BADB